MFCTICGNTIYQDESFCSKCGKNVMPRAEHPSGPARANPPPGGYNQHKEHNRNQGKGDQPRYSNYDLPLPVPTRSAAGGHHHGKRPHHPERMHPPQAVGSYPQHSPQANRGLKKAAVIAICIALFALGVSVGGFFVMRISTQNTNQPQQPIVGDSTPTPLPERLTPTPTPPPEEDTSETPPPEETEDPEDIEDPEDVRSARFPFPGNLSRYGGSAEADVAFLQNTLNHMRRHYPSIRLIDAAGGTFGAATFGAVIDFQQRVGLPATGVVDEDTWYTLVELFENPPTQADPPFEPATQEWYVVLVNLHLRTEPSMAGESIEVIPQWSRVWVAYYIQQDSWYFVQTEEGYTGYMKAEFLLLDGILQ